MMLRYLVSSWVRQMGQDKAFSSVAQAARNSFEQALRSETPSGGDAAGETPRCSTLVAFALGIESGGMVDLLQHGVTTKCPSFVEHCGLLAERRLGLIETGVGRQAAAKGTADAITLHRPDWIVSAGFAGALCPELKRGDMLMASHVSDVAGEQLDVGLGLDQEAIAAQPHLHTGRLLTVDQLVRSKAEKRELGEKFGAIACDMETMAVAQVCRREQVRFLSVRVISDALDDELPPEIERLLDQKSLAGKLGAATGAIFNRPSSVKDMWRLKEDAIRASDRLAKFLVGVIGQL